VNSGVQLGGRWKKFSARHGEVLKKQSSIETRI
jgi:hypothetical protein